MDKKPDMLDGMLKYAAMGGKYGRIVSDYPETVQAVLREFLNVWMIPEFSVPKKMKKVTGEYKEWIESLQSLESLCGGKLSLIKDGYEHYMSSGQTFMVTCPRNILKLMVDVIARKNREAASSKTTIVEAEPVRVLATDDVVFKSLKALKESLKGE